MKISYNADLGLIATIDAGMTLQAVPEDSSSVGLQWGNIYCQEVAKDGAPGATIWLPINYGEVLRTDLSFGMAVNKCDSMILSDGDKILPITYNPKVSSFKTNILESKIDTLSGGYPIFVRNGNMSYKEFPLSGLLTREIDFFNSFKQNPQSERKERTFTPENEPLLLMKTDQKFAAERAHKIEVEKWLNNGKWKILVAPGEGTYIVRLMNVSLTPVEQLGRRLHSFSATAYEVAEFNTENLFSKNLSFANGLTVNTNTNPTEGLPLEIILDGGELI